MCIPFHSEEICNIARQTTSLISHNKLKEENQCNLKAALITKQQLKCIVGQIQSTLLARVSSGMSSSRLKDKHNLVALDMGPLH